MSQKLNWKKTRTEVEMKKAASDRYHTILGRKPRKSRKIRGPRGERRTKEQILEETYGGKA